MANCWELSYLYKNLRLGFIGSKHLKWNGLEEQVLTVRNCDVTISYGSSTSWYWIIICWKDGSESYWTLYSNISDVQGDTILSIAIGVVIPPYLNLVMETLASILHFLLNSPISPRKPNGLGFRIRKSINTWASDLVVTCQRRSRLLDSWWIVEGDCGSSAFGNQDLANTHTGDQFSLYDVIHMLSGGSCISGVGTIRSIHGSVDDDVWI